MTTDIINNLSDVFELATNTTKFVKELMELKPTSKENISNKNNSKLAASGDYSQLAASGYNSKLAASGDYSQLAASGYNSKLAASGHYSQLAASGDNSKLAAAGEYSVVCAIGKYSTARAKKGSWITLAEYDKENKPTSVITEFVDGKIIKEDVDYCLCDGKFREFIEADGIKSAVLTKKGNVYKVKNFGEEKQSYLIEKDGVFSHGETIKQAKESFMYKISDRDTSKYKDLNLNSVVSKEEAIKMYRTITGACESGTKYYVNSLKTVKNEYTVSEIFELTKGQYGNDIFKDFFERCYEKNNI
jgi:hypothetical protein